MNMDEEYPTYLQRLLRGDYEGCAAIVDDILGSGTAVRDLYEGLFTRNLYEVGHLWETHQISVAKEHLATAVTERLLARVAPGIFAGEHLQRSAIVCCTTNEVHQVGGRMVADTLEMNRWHAYFLGANLPFDDLLSLVEEKSPDILALSVAIPTNLPSLESAIEKVRETHPRLPILIGGQAFLHGGRDIPDRYPEVTLLGSLRELESFVQGY